MPTIALRYRRVSTLKQLDNTSLETQLDRLNTYCSSLDYITLDDLLYTDALTGDDTWQDRVELGKLLRRVEELVKDPSYEVCVVSDHPDRFARGFDLVWLVSVIERLGARVEFVQQKFESDDIGKIVLHMQAWGSKQELTRIKKRTSDGRKAYVAKNHILGPTPSYGYKFNEDHTCYVLNTTVIHKDATGKEWTEVLVVQFIFEQVKKGVTLRAIAKKLMDLGIKTRKGHTFWHHATLTKMLKNPVYIGKFTAFREDFTHEGTRINQKGQVVPHYRRTPKPVEEHYHYPDGTVPAIIDVDTFAYVQERLTYNQKVASRNNRHHEDALCRAGIAYCGYCGARMQVSSPTHTPLQYQCPTGNKKKGKCDGYNTISVPLLDREVWREVCSLIRNPHELEKNIEALKTPDPTETTRIPLEERKKSLEEEIENLVELGRRAKSKPARNRILSDIKSLEEELSFIEEQEKNIQSEHKLWLETQKAIDNFYLWCREWEEKLEEASYNNKRVCLEYLGVRVNVFRYGSKPRYTITFSPESIMKKLRVVVPQSRLRLTISISVAAS